MRFSMRLRLPVAILLTSLLLLVAFVGTASAYYLNPHIAASPFHIISDVSGCAAVNVSGYAFTHSTASTPNFAEFRVSDTYGAASTAGGDVQQVNNRGRFSGVLTICGLGLPEDTINIVAFDFATGVPSNTVHIESDT
jgi:hypothetical protein